MRGTKIVAVPCASVIARVEPSTLTRTPDPAGGPMGFWLSPEKEKAETFTRAILSASNSSPEAKAE